MNQTEFLHLKKAQRLIAVEIDNMEKQVIARTTSVEYAAGFMSGLRMADSVIARIVKDDDKLMQQRLVPTYGEKD